MRNTRAALLSAGVVVVVLWGLFYASYALAATSCPDGWGDVWASGGFSDGRQAVVTGDTLEAWNFFESESTGNLYADGVLLGPAPGPNDGRAAYDLPSEGTWTISADGRVSVCVRAHTSITITTTTSTTIPEEPTTTTSTVVPNETTTTIVATTTTLPAVTSSTAPTTTAVPSTSEPPTPSVPPTTPIEPPVDTPLQAAGFFRENCEGFQLITSGRVDTNPAAGVAAWSFVVYQDDVVVGYWEGPGGPGAQTVPLPPGEYRGVFTLTDLLGKTEVVDDRVATVPECLASSEPPVLYSTEPAVPTATISTTSDTLPETGLTLFEFTSLGALLLGLGAGLEALARKRQRR